MAFNEMLAARIRAVHRDALIVRLGPEVAAGALTEPYTRVFDLTGRPMKAWVLVEAKGLATDAQLGKWLDRAARWAESLPPK